MNKEAIKSEAAYTLSLFKQKEVVITLMALVIFILLTALLA